MAFKVRVDVDIFDTQKRLERLKPALRKKAMRKALTKGAQAVAKMAKQLAPRRITFRKVKTRINGRKRTVKVYGAKTSYTATIGGVTSNITYSGGALKRSIGHKIKVYRRAIVAIVGPRDGFRERIGTVSRGKNRGKPIYNDPAKYAHLVELGTRHSKAVPFLRESAQYGQHVTLTYLNDAVQQAIAAESRR